MVIAVWKQPFLRLPARARPYKCPVRLFATVGAPSVPSRRHVCFIAFGRLFCRYARQGFVVRRSVHLVKVAQQPGSVNAVLDWCAVCQGVPLVIYQAAHPVLQASCELAHGCSNKLGLVLHGLGSCTCPELCHLRILPGWAGGAQSRRLGAYFECNVHCYLIAGAFRCIDLETFCVRAGGKIPN